MRVTRPLLACAVLRRARAAAETSRRRHAVDRRRRAAPSFATRPAGSPASTCAPVGSPIPIFASWFSFPNLTHLDLSLTRITDQGMQELKNAARHRRSEPLFRRIRDRRRPGRHQGLEEAEAAECSRHQDQRHHSRSHLRHHDARVAECRLRRW